jgi:hypothetical protein
VAFIQKTISRTKAFLALLAFQSLLKVQKYMGSLSNVGFRVFSLSVFSGWHLFQEYNNMKTSIAMCVSQKIRPFEITTKLLVFLLLFNEDELTQTTNGV